METVQLQGEPSSPGMGDLPESCIASILRLITPRDVARLACVSRIFRNASYSDSVWQTMLPTFYEDILAQAPDAPASTCSKKEIYDFLSTPVLLENGTQDFWLDRATGGVCRSIGAKGLFVVWGDDQRYWSWIEQEGSRFAKVAYLIRVCWLEVRGSMQCCLPPGTYTLSWRLSFSLGTNNFKGFNYKPVKFSFEGPDHVPVDFEKALTTNEIFQEGGLPPLWTRGGDKKWVELDVGEFTVERGDSPVDIKFSMMQIEGGFWKGGLLLDSVLIRPTRLSEHQRN
ncbi:unnamed protein product [Calypogeia fissa]